MGDWREELDDILDRQPGCPLPDCLACRRNKERADAIHKGVSLLEQQARALRALEHAARELVKARAAVDAGVVDESVTPDQLQALLGVYDAQFAQLCRVLGEPTPRPLGSPRECADPCCACVDGFPCGSPREHDGTNCAETKLETGTPAS
jgi:hypothetical protein